MKILRAPLSIRSLVRWCSVTAEPPRSNFSDSELDDAVGTILGNVPVPLSHIARQLPDDVMEQFSKGLKAHLLRRTESFEVFRNPQTDVTMVRLRTVRTGALPPPPTITDKAPTRVSCIPTVITKDSTPSETESYMRRYLNIAAIRALKALNVNRMPHNYALFHDVGEAVTDRDQFKKMSDFDRIRAVANLVDAANRSCFTERLVVCSVVGVLNDKATQTVTMMEGLEILSFLHRAEKEETLVKVVQRKAAPEETLTASHIDVVGLTDAGPLPHLCELSVYARLLPEVAHLFPVDDEHPFPGLVQEYDAYRAARFLNVETFIPISAWGTAIEPVTSKDPLHIALSFPHLFALDHPQKPRNIKFLLNDKWLPKFISMNKDELDAKVIAVREQIKACAYRENSERSSAKKKLWLLRQAQAAQQYLHPALDHDVLAHYLFDLLGEEEHQTGLVPALLPEPLRCLTNAKEKVFLRKYPHLFVVIERPPIFVLKRADLVSPKDVPDADGVLQSVSEEEIGQMILAASIERFIKVNPSSKHQSPYMLPSHVTKFLPDFVRKFTKEKYGGLQQYFEAHPQSYALKIGVHPFESTVTPIIDGNPLTHDEKRGETAEF